MITLSFKAHNLAREETVVSSLVSPPRNGTSSVSLAFGSLHMQPNTFSRLSPTSVGSVSLLCGSSPLPDL